MKKNRLLSLYLPIIISLIVSCTAIPFPQVSGTAVPVPQVGETAILIPRVSDTAYPVPRGGETALPNTPTPTVYLPLINKTTALPRAEVTEFYVAPYGTANGNGSINNPWDLQTALNYPSGVKPGDTIWIRGGTYGDGGSTIFNSKLVGEAGKPITVRAFPGEQVVIDGSIMVYREYTTFWGLEVLNSDLKRSTTIAGSTPDDISRSDGFNVLASNTKFINNIVHDQGEGFGFWKQAVNAELYGNIVYNNGWQGPDRGHGYSIYAQNEVGTKLIRDNITFNNFGQYGVHVYGESIRLLGFRFEGNVNFNGQFLIGGLQPAGDIRLIDNYFYSSPMRFGYHNQNNQNITLKNNYFGAQGSNTLELKWWQDVDISGNQIWTDTTENVSFTYPDTTGSYNWDNNVYYAPDSDAFIIENDLLNWELWKNETGFDQNSSFTIGLPSGIDVFVRPNEYEAKRAHIIIYNWDEMNSVPVDISQVGLEIGQKYVLHNTQNYYAETIEGTYNGVPIIVPMTGWSIAKPTGWSEPLQPSTFPQFGVFLLIGR